MPEVHLDLSSIGQGYSVGKVADVLKRYNIDNYLVEIGDEMVVHGSKLDGSAWKIAIEKPLPEQRIMQKVLLINFPQAIMTSGTYRHYFDHLGQRYSHIIDARGDSSKGGGKIMSNGDQSPYKNASKKYVQEK